MSSAYPVAVLDAANSLEQWNGRIMHTHSWRPHHHGVQPTSGVVKSVSIRKKKKVSLKKKLEWCLLQVCAAASAWRYKATPPTQPPPWQIITWDVTNLYACSHAAMGAPSYFTAATLCQPGSAAAAASIHRPYCGSGSCLLYGDGGAGSRKGSPCCCCMPCKSCSGAAAAPVASAAGCRTCRRNTNTRRCGTAL